jgi:SagB-type dehydrogenase family enzyme
VEGLERGAYAYDSYAHCLQTICKKDMTLFLQQRYLLQNYNIADAGAVIAIVGNLENMLKTYGNRGYRLLNAEAGLIAQGIYMVSTALSVACGTVLGFANFALNTELGLDGTGDKTLLFVMVGHENRDSADMDYRLV